MQKDFTAFRRNLTIGFGSVKWNPSDSSQKLCPVCRTPECVCGEQWVTKGTRAEGVDVAEGCGLGVADGRVELEFRGRAVVSPVLR